MLLPLELVSLPHFLDDFRKYISHTFFIDWPNFIAWLSLLFQILGNMRIVIICCPVPDVIIFEINHSFMIKPLFYITKKPGQKFKHLKNEKGFLTLKKHFSLLLKSFQLSEIVSDPQERAFELLKQYFWVKVCLVIIKAKRHELIRISVFFNIGKIPT